MLDTNSNQPPISEFFTFEVIESNSQFFGNFYKEFKSAPKIFFNKKQKIEILGNTLTGSILNITDFNKELRRENYELENNIWEENNNVFIDLDNDNISDLVLSKSKKWVF